MAPARVVPWSWLTNRLSGEAIVGPVRNLLTDGVASSSVTRQFWSRRGEWCQGSMMLVETAEPPRQACPICGKIVHVHRNRRLHAHFPTRNGAASAVPTVRAAP